MCGITGYIRFSSEKTADASHNIDAMTTSLQHRGPDDQGTYLNNKVGLALGHRRLSILDISSNGHQPMHSHSKRFVIVYNGEIYNHNTLRERCSNVRFKSQCDTETLLEHIELHGIEETLENIHGMFAFALWDNLTKKLLLCRDRAGEKPLYYSLVNGTLVFGSELKALKKYPRFDATINLDALDSFLRYGYIPSPLSIYKETQKLEAGHYLEFTAENGLNMIQYWHPEKIINRDQQYHLTDDERVGKLHQLLKESVVEQMISDVPLGAFLSGGIDSSLIVSLMQKHSNTKVKTFTIGFDQKNYDESTKANAIANFLGTDHHSMIVNPEMIREVIPLLPAIYDEPFADVSQLPTYLLAKMTREHVTVSLSGDGADELFGGYERHFRGIPMWKKTRRLPSFARKVLSIGLASIPPGYYDHIKIPFMKIDKLGHKAHKMADLINAESIEAYNKSSATYWNKADSMLLNKGSYETIYDSVKSNPNLSDEEWLMFCDYKAYLGDDILVKVDRAAMAVSLETRVPYLSKNIMNYALDLPLDFKIRNGQSKWILKQILKSYLPSTVIDQPKMGFFVPIDEWLRGPLKGWAEDLLEPGKILEDNLLDSEVVKSVWCDFKSGRINNQYLVWNLLMFQQWNQNKK